MLNTIIIAGLCGAAAAAGSWTWNEVVHIHSHLHLLEDRATKLESQ